MLRYFFLTFILVTVCFPRPSPAFCAATKMTHLPFPDLPGHEAPAEVYGSQHPSDFFADGRANREPVAGTIPIGYEVCRIGYYQNLAQATACDTGYSATSRTTYNTGKIGDLLRRRLSSPIEVDEKLHRRAGKERFEINCTDLPRPRARWATASSRTYGLVTVAKSLRTNASALCRTASHLQHHHERQEHHGRLRPADCGGRPLGDYRPTSGVLQKSQNMKLAEPARRSAAKRTLNSKP